MKSKIKPYTITVATYGGLMDYDAVGYFLKEGDLVIERPDGRRKMINHDTWEEIDIESHDDETN